MRDQNYNVVEEFINKVDAKEIINLISNLLFFSLFSVFIDMYV